MREILFRGKSIKSGEWIFGNLLRTDYGVFVIQNYAPFEGLDKYEVEPKTVCQYTGLEDKNGNKIFEGDCIGHKLNVVEYLHDCFTINGDRPLFLFAKDCEIVGNIFDNTVEDNA